MAVASIVLRSPDDFHVHLRESNLLSIVAPLTYSIYRRALVMPNLFPRPVITPKDVVRYHKAIRQRTRFAKSDFSPLMTIMLTGSTFPDMIGPALEAGAFAAKLYPVGATTNSDNGLELTNFAVRNRDLLREMESCGMVLCIHAEIPYGDPFDREKLALRELTAIAENFPDLKIVVEHVSSNDGVQWVKSFKKNVAATITAHHMALTRTDMLGGKLHPHQFCKPILKTETDRVSLINAARFDSRFFFGSDSAPHYRGKKECADGNAGCFVPGEVALPVLAAIFSEHGDDTWTTELEDFVSKRGADFYGLNYNDGTITLNPTEWKVPKTYKGIVPLMAGQTLKWKVV